MIPIEILVVGGAVVIVDFRRVNDCFAANGRQAVPFHLDTPVTLVEHALARSAERALETGRNYSCSRIWQLSPKRDQKRNGPIAFG